MADPRLPARSTFRFTAPVDVVVIQSKKAPCAECGGPHVITLKADPSGYSVGSDLEHREECSKLRCAHGVRWDAVEDCAGCDAEREEDCVGFCEGCGTEINAGRFCDHCEVLDD